PITARPQFQGVADRQGRGEPGVVAAGPGRRAGRRALGLPRRLPAVLVQRRRDEDRERREQRDAELDECDDPQRVTAPDEQRGGERREERESDADDGQSRGLGALRLRGQLPEERGGGDERAVEDERRGEPPGHEERGDRGAYAVADTAPVGTILDVRSPPAVRRHRPRFRRNRSTAPPAAIDPWPPPWTSAATARSPWVAIIHESTR